MTGSTTDDDRLRGAPPGGLPNPVDVSVLTPVLDEAEFILDTVRAMQAQRFEGSIEFLFIDGGSADATRALLEDLSATESRIRTLDNPFRTTTHALNIGLRHSRGRFVVRMDAHTHYPGDYIDRGVRRLLRGDVAWVSGPQLPRGRGLWSRRVELALGSRLGAGGAAFRKPLQKEIDVDSGFTGVWRRETLLELGGWDEAWPINQDAELAARVRARGERIVCVPQMAAEYIPRDSLRMLARQYWRYGRYRAKTCRHHPEAMRRSHVLAPGLVIASLGAVLPSGFIRRACRALLAAYAIALSHGAVALRHTGAARDVAWLPAVWMTMHAAWGAGFTVGSLQFGIPARALWRVLVPPRLRRGRREYTG